MGGRLIRGTEIHDMRDAFQTGSCRAVHSGQHPPELDGCWPAGDGTRASCPLTISDLADYELAMSHAYQFPEVSRQEGQGRMDAGLRIRGAPVERWFRGRFL